MPALIIRGDLSVSDLRRLARREPDRRAALRLLAIANVRDGLSRAEAARLAGMERQALRDAVVRYNAEGPDGLHDRQKVGPARRAEPRAAGGTRGPPPAPAGVSFGDRIDRLLTVDGSCAAPIRSGTR
jgi:hypothetical protein